MRLLIDNRLNDIVVINYEFKPMNDINALKRISDIDLNKKRYIRAGIIPYIITEDGEYVYALGLACYNGTIFDLGGHCEELDEDIIDTAVREFNEECYYVFGRHITRDHIIENDCPVLDGLDCQQNIGTLEILVQVDVDMYDVMERFHKIVAKERNPEISNIIWLTGEQMKYVYGIQHPISYNGVQPFRTYYRIVFPINHWIASSVL